MMTIAVLSDTHGLLRPEIPNAIAGIDYIIYAGELGNIDYQIQP
jgi:predicted phosphodiesterase